MLNHQIKTTNILRKIAENALWITLCIEKTTNYNDEFIVIMGNKNPIEITALNSAILTEGYYRLLHNLWI